MAVAFDQRPDAIWFDGKLVATADCEISVLTHGLHYASCVFEGERAYGGEIFKGTLHTERLKRSAQILDFEIPYSVAEIDAAKRLVLEKNNQKDAYVRPIAWRGSEQLGVSAQSVYHWEQGKSRPRANQVRAIAALRGLGKRQVAARLTELAS